MTDKALFKTIETPSVDERVDRTGMGARAAWRFCVDALVQFSTRPSRQLRPADKSADSRRSVACTSVWRSHRLRQRMAFPGRMSGTYTVERQSNLRFLR